jgi:PAS domain S-box-containing protein
MRTRDSEPRRTDSAAELARLQQHNTEILNAAGEGIYGLDLGGYVTFVNPTAARLTGHDVQELLGQRMHDLIHHTRADGCGFAREVCPIYAALRDGEVHQVDDEVFWRKDGSSFPVHYTSTPIRRDGRLAGAVVVFRDITERKRAEADLRYALAEVRALKEQVQARNAYLQEEIDRAHDFGEIVGESQPLREMLRVVAQVAPTDATVLIQGESGTGKELVARAVHELSDRKHGPLVKINCAAMTPALIESELFGHEKGAFTDANQRRIGRFELAHNGTVFLDEIGELPPATQVKLLRVLQEREFERVGGSRTIAVNVRVVAATNRDLSALVARGEFRLDLFYRLNVLPIDVPPLRVRKEDIPLLVAAYLSKLGKRLGCDVRGITQSSMDGLLAYDWPGNVRELQNVIERAAILARGPVLSVQGLIRPQEPPVRGLAQLPQSGPETLVEHERAHILRALEYTGWRVAGDRGAGAVLGMHPNTLRSRMKRLGISRAHE